jgi:hypothetical protein
VTILFTKITSSSLSSLSSSSSSSTSFANIQNFFLVIEWRIGRRLRREGDLKRYFCF